MTEVHSVVTDCALFSAQYPEEEVLALAGGLEKSGEHPLAEAIVQFAATRVKTLPRVSQFDSYAGKGARGTVNGREVVIGNAALMREIGIETDKVSTAFVAIDGTLAASFDGADPVKRGSREAEARLGKKGRDGGMPPAHNPPPTTGKTTIRFYKSCFHPTPSRTGGE